MNYGTVQASLIWEDIGGTQASRMCRSLSRSTHGKDSVVYIFTLVVATASSPHLPPAGHKR